MGTLLLYGANGYTGRIIAELATARDIEVILGGRNEAAIEQMGAEMGLPHRVFSLADPIEVAAGLQGIHTVLHCAGPFSHTAAPMAQACIESHTHYLDITGEIGVFEYLCRKLGPAAQAAGVMLLPGVGFDVVPSDCLARYLSEKCPGATHLTLAISGEGGVSHGTATTAVENIGEGGAVRIDGKITAVPAAWKTREFDFGSGRLTAVTIPWGDVSTAWHSTGIPNISVYMAAPSSLRRLMVLSRYTGWALGSGLGQKMLKSRIPDGGPSPETRASGQSIVVGEATAPDGSIVCARLTCPEAYQLTAEAALHIAIRVLNDEVQPGFQTPSSAFDADLVLGLDGVTREDLETL